MSQAQVRLLAAGLADLGFRRGDRLIVIGDNRPRLYWSMCAAQSLGGVPVPVYQDSVTDELAYVVEHAGARFALAENQEQVDKLLEIRKRVPSLGVVIYDDPRGLRYYEGLLSYDAVLERGAQVLAGRWAWCRPRSPRGAGRTTPSCSIPRAPPAGPRARC